MALIEYSPPPLFEDGQVMSTEGHLNTLVRDTNILFGEHMAISPGFHAPLLGTDFKGFGRPDQPFIGYYRLFVGAIRHKRDTFAYCINISDVKSTTVHVRVRYGPEGDALIANHTTAVPADITGTINVAKMSVGSFYEIFVDVWCGDERIPSASVVYLGETYTISLATLDDFITGTPSVADWQLLSTYVESLYSYLMEPAIAPTMRAEHSIHNFLLPGQTQLQGPWLGVNDTTARYRIVHKHKFLAYQFQINPHDINTNLLRNATWMAYIVYNGNTIPLSYFGFTCLNHNLDASETTVDIDSTYVADGTYVRIEYGEIIKLGTGAPYDGGTRFTGCLRAQFGTVAAAANGGTYACIYIDADHNKNVFRKDWFPLKDYVVYRGILDISGETLDLDATYLVEVKNLMGGHDEHEDQWYQTQIDYLFETPEADPHITGWVALPLHTAITTPTDCAQRLRNNLTWLYAHATYLNQVSPHMSPNGIDHGGTFVRRRRYLHYYTMSSEQDGQLTFYINGREQTQSISPGNYHWNSLDMDSVPGLFPGTIYKVTGLCYALEDNDSISVWDLDLLNRDEDGL